MLDEVPEVTNKKLANDFDKVFTLHQGQKVVKLVEIQIESSLEMILVTQHKLA